MGNERIKLEDSTLDVLQKMSGGNPGAATVLVQIFKEGPRIDPDSFHGGLSNILTLDSIGIYEDKIWLLYKDICGQDIAKMIAVLRATGLGFYSRETLLSAVKNIYRGQTPVVPVEELYEKVKERLPNFNSEN